MQLELKREQAASRQRQAQEAGEAAAEAEAWAARLEGDRLPPLPPVRLRGSLKMREEALAAHAAAAQARVAVNAEAERRTGAVQRLSAAISEVAATPGGPLASALEFATAKLAVAQERRRRYSEARGELAEPLRVAAAGQTRRPMRPRYCRCIRPDDSGAAPAPRAMTH